MAQPQTVASDLIERLINWPDEPISEFEKANFKRQINSLKQRDTSAGLMVEGMFYARLGMTKESRNAHNLSLNASGRSFICLSNYAVSLKILMYYSESFELLVEALKKGPTSRKALFDAAKLCSYCGKFEEMNKITDDYIRATQDTDIWEEEEIKDLFRYGKEIERFQLSERDSHKVFEKLEQLFRKYKLSPTDEIIGTYNAEDHQYLYVEHRVHAPGEVLAKMNEELSDLIAEDVEIECWNTFVHRFTYHPEKPE